MIKKGFTLQEALITLGIVGVVAAITVPGLAKLTPNQNQTRFLKAHNALSNLTKQMLVDPALYWFNSDDRNCDGLGCATMPAQGSVPDALLDHPFLGNNAFAGNLSPLRKYMAILAYNMHTSDNQIGDNNTFTTTDGMVWTFNANDDNNTFEVVIDVNGVQGPNFQPENGDNNVYFNQDVFNVLVDMNGNISANDATGSVYLENAEINLNRRSKHAQELAVSQGQVNFIIRNIDIRTVYNKLCESGNDVYCNATYEPPAVKQEEMHIQN